MSNDPETVSCAGSAECTVKKSVTGCYRIDMHAIRVNLYRYGVINIGVACVQDAVAVVVQVEENRQGAAIIIDYAAFGRILCNGAIVKHLLYCIGSGVFVIMEDVRMARRVCRCGVQVGNI